ncbi:MAG: DUF2378 family protein [Myxococcales bacterium]|nr:DUF2378 family protein [Myxococcales bacterium]
MGSVNAGRHAGLTVDLARGLAELGLERRLADTPSGAHIRGLFFKLAEHALAERSKDLVTVWRAASGARSRWSFRMYSTRDFLREQAIAAALLQPDDPGEGLRRMWTSTPRLTPLIRADGFMRYLGGNEPMGALRWLEHNRGMMCDYGDWWVEPTGTSSATFHYRDEYTWIEHCHLGGVEGTLVRCGVSPVVTTELDGPYRGRLLIRWA